MGLRKADREWPRPRTTRHVWIKSDRTLSAPVQGLVLEWRRHSYRWSALVQYVNDERDGTVTYVQRWFPAEQLWPVKSDPNGPNPLQHLH